MKRILLIATGGTIASKPTGAGLVPVLSPEEILRCVPGVAEVCRVETAQPMNLDSTNIGPMHWLMLEDCIERHYGSFDGFVVAHGTDTMAYTAGALTYLVQHSPKPIVLTGSQKSIFMEDTDARGNLFDAFLYASDARSNGVTVVFGGKIITGARARKTRTKSWNAFSSMDYPELGIIQDGKILRYIAEPEEHPHPAFYRALNEKVALVKLIPGMDAGVLSYLKERYDALILESFGMGGVPHYGDAGLVAAVDAWCAAGKCVVMTTQVPHEGSDMALYQVGRQVKQRTEMIEAYNMTLEAIVTKLMWILAITRESMRVREMFYTPIAHDLLLLE